jgi:transglutaminase-like putative cysteine protease
VSGAAIPAARAAPARRGWIPGEKASRDRATARPALAIELPLFAALGVLAMAQWARLVEPSAADRLGPALAVACGVAVLLWAVSFLRPGALRFLLALTIAVCGICGALLAAGLPLHLLAPGEWPELRAHIRGGTGGIEEAQLPYGGADPWVRLTLVLGSPALVAAAAALGFWPAARRDFLRAAALALLLIAYGVGATLDNPGAEAFWGVVLLALAAAWLWVPALQPGRRAQAMGVVLGAGVLALPLVAKLNGPAWWDYETWSWFGAQRTVQFDWNHDYGPLDWPREGTTLMTVQSETPQYWKASVLDRFNGFHWERAVADDPEAFNEMGARDAIPGSGVERKHPGWVVSADFELRALSSDVVIGAGTTDTVDGIEGTLASADGTLTHTGEPLDRGDEYSITAYSPQPTTYQLRAAPPATSRRRFSGATLLAIPDLDGTTSTEAMPLWGRTDPEAASFLLDSPYADTYRLALDWTADARTPYDAVHAIEGHLRRDFGYTPTVPEHLYPLQAFLFADRAGYCQQFAGTMGLMLRMLGIPTRVVSGFAPGSLNTSTGAYEVHDFDAHSWVEVYFRGIGWVTFDPTPAAAPAESQRLGGEFATEFRGPPRDQTAPAPAGGARSPAPDSSEPAAVTGASEGGPGAAIALGALAVALVLGLFVAGVSWRRRRRLLAGAAGEDQLAEFQAAVGRLAWHLAPGTTLLAIERRATGRARAGIRDYAAALRSHRYAPGATPAPGPAERRALRRSLRGNTLTGRLRALLAVPPGGPARA